MSEQLGNRMINKKCTKCGETKAAKEFRKDRRNFDGLSSQCNACRGENQREYHSDKDPRKRRKVNRK